MECGGMGLGAWSPEEIQSSERLNAMIFEDKTRKLSSRRSACSIDKTPLR